MLHQNLVLVLSSYTNVTSTKSIIMYYHQTQMLHHRNLQSNCIVKEFLLRNNCLLQNKIAVCYEMTVCYRMMFVKNECLL